MSDPSAYITTPHITDDRWRDIRELDPDPTDTDAHLILTELPDGRHVGVRLASTVSLGRDIAIDGEVYRITSLRRMDPGEQTDHYRVTVEPL